MKNTASYGVIIAVIIFLVSCKSFEPSLLDSLGQPFAEKLPAMNTVVENNLVAIVSADGSSITGPNPFDVKSYFENEVQDIMTNPYGEKHGTVKLKVENYEQKAFWPIFFFLPLLYTPCIFGAPAVIYTSVVGVEIEVLSESGRLIGKYKGKGEHKETVAGMRGSYKESVASRVAYLQSVKKAVQEAKGGLQKDIPRLLAELSK